MFRKVPEASAQDSGPEGSRKPRIYASSREFWKLLETLQGSWGRSCWRLCRAAGAEAAGADQNVLDCAGVLGSAAEWAGTVATQVL